MGVSWVRSGSLWASLALLATPMGAQAQATVTGTVETPVVVKATEHPPMDCKPLPASAQAYCAQYNVALKGCAGKFRQELKSCLAAQLPANPAMDCARVPDDVKARSACDARNTRQVACAGRIGEDLVSCMRTLAGPIVSTPPENTRYAPPPAR